MRTFNYFLSLLFILASSNCFSQTNIISTNGEAEQVMQGQYAPADYQASQVISAKDDIVAGLLSGISPDSLKSYIASLESFYTRHTASDTLSADTGVGAARKWVFSKFEQWSGENENRLLTSYLQFDQDICGITRHKNIFAVLPGNDLSDKSVILIEGHMDSRCEDRCDSDCFAPGAEDNGSGTALVMELARVMSRFTFDRTIVFLVTIGEEQGLLGANAFAEYTGQKDIAVRAVQNNDVSGGILCGKTSSPPSCPHEHHVDSTHIRIFSSGISASDHKGLARFIKLQFVEELKPRMTVPMDLWLMVPEDRTGRGGDHIPFRQRGIAAVRFTAANEHGDANPVAGYVDRQHSVRDVIGVDTDGDQIIDSFFVNFRYLARNAAINGTSAAMAANGPETPTFDLESVEPNRLRVEITSQKQYNKYRVGLRTDSTEFNQLFTMNGPVDTFDATPATLHWVSVASVDGEDIESLFAKEQFKAGDPTGIAPVREEKFAIGIRPNPFRSQVTVVLESSGKWENARLVIVNTKGQEIINRKFTIEKELTEITFEFPPEASGYYFCTLFVEGTSVATKRLLQKGSDRD